MANLYFGYGSNLDPDQQARFCPSGLEPVGPAYLPDRELAFTRISPRWGGGVLDVRRRRGAVTAGYVFRLRDEEAGYRELDEKEGVRGDPYDGTGGYRRFDTVALTLDGDAMPVTTYEVREPVPYVKPDPSYVQAVRRGYERWGLDHDQLRRAAEDADPGTDPRVGANPERAGGAVFIYGTLLRGCERHHHLRVPELRSVLLAEAEGTLHDQGAYPGFVPGGSRFVMGEFASFDSVSEVLGKLDAIEGFEGFEGRGAEAARGDLFHRRLLSVGLQDRRRVGWAYVPAEPSGVAIEPGCWRTHRGVEESVTGAIARAHGDARGLLSAMADRGPFPVADRDAFVEDHLPLGKALSERRISERELAQHSGVWAADVG